MVTKVIPGLFVEFKYSKARSDRLPLVLVLANGKNEHAVNSKTKTLLDTDPNLQLSFNALQESKKGLDN